MTLTKFMARSTWVAHAFEWEKLLKCHLKGKTSKKLANGQNIDYSEKRKWPKGFICPCTGVKYHKIQTCLLVYAADSGERLQDHWSSGLSCNILCTFSSYTIYMLSVQCLGQTNCLRLFMKFNGSVHFGLLMGILYRFLVIVFNLKLDVFHVLQPSQVIMLSSFFLSY